ncbi:hypothetical protein RvY_16677-2 [Ramazzottius varieornatus]|nr:hypothetical protein RvY_16677-2 [Ramazzottius varieornatus]
MNLIKESKTLQATYGGSGSFKSFKDLKKLYKQTKKMGLPLSQKHWTSDYWFGAQRIQGANPVLIKLARSIPTNLDFDPSVVKEILGGMTLQEAVDAKRIFKIDLKVLKDLPCAGGRTICCPIALFYLDQKKNDLLPLCIQLFQEPNETNPVFYPTDPPYAWLVAKMYYNNADSAMHQSITHLGFTHIIMEGTVICTHRHLSEAHPMFKLMAPHFLFLLAINKRGLDKLINIGGWVDKTTVYGVEGMLEVMRRKLDVWKLDEDPIPPADCARRGVLDKFVLPYYPYRDDAVAVYYLIEKYVRTVVRHFYDSPDKIEHDYELQNWAAELVRPREEGGLGLNGIAGNGRFTHVEQIVSVISAMICTCSVGHAASNFMQYDE